MVDQRVGGVGVGEREVGGEGVLNEVADVVFDQGVEVYGRVRIIEAGRWIRIEGIGWGSRNISSFKE